MKLPHIALLMASTFVSYAHADQLVNIAAGSVVECVPFPSVKTLDVETVFQGGKLASSSMVTCVVTKGQTVPMGSKFLGELVDGPAPNSYAFQWEALQVADGYSVRWSNAERDQPSSIQGNSGNLRLTFKLDLTADKAE
ncbi:hypothetical protein [Pseudomonas sp.]|uniref:hypothetical protein n=1 Tax=Pseudomonas sp. TaxID=306 RepID=UPI0029137FF3|nr:hypothetical protein [Pseudomonas sp.]MDU4254559.1 hypothetical protein [Pseudomonas sp.]